MNDRPRAAIRVYSASLTWETRVSNLAAVEEGYAIVLVCTNGAGLGVDAEVTLQWENARYLSLAALVQRIGRARRDQRIEVIAMTMAGYA